MTDLSKFNNKGEERKPNAPSTPHTPSIAIDYALYEKYLEGSDLSESQKRDFLDALWSIMVSFVDLGFEIHPLQQAQTPCEQNGEQNGNSADHLFQSVQQMIDCETQPKQDDRSQKEPHSGPKFEP